MKTLTQEIAQLEQRKHRELLQRNRAKRAKRQEEDRRKFIVGGLFLAAFPEYQQLRPQQTAEGNELEFMELKYFLDELAAHRTLVETLHKVAARMTRSTRSALMNPGGEAAK